MIPHVIHAYTTQLTTRTPYLGRSTIFSQPTVDTLTAFLYSSIPKIRVPVIYGPNHVQS